MSMENINRSLYCTIYVNYIKTIQFFTKKPKIEFAFNVNATYIVCKTVHLKPQ